MAVKADEVKEKLSGAVGALKRFDVKALKDKALGLFMGPKDVLGVDIGSSAVKIVQLGEEQGVVRLKAWGHLPIPVKADASPEERQQQVVNLLKAFKIDRKSVV